MYSSHCPFSQLKSIAPNNQWSARINELEATFDSIASKPI